MKRIIYSVALLSALGVGAVLWPFASRYYKSKRKSSYHSMFMQTTSMEQTQAGDPRYAKEVASFKAGTKTSAPIFRHATRIEIFHLFPNAPEEKSANSIRGFPIYQSATLPDATLGPQLGAILLRPESYVVASQDILLCYLMPAVAYRVWSGAQSLDVLICFHCNQLGVIENDPHVPIRNLGGRIDARMNVLGDFAPARAELLALTKRAFVSDDAVQAIQ